MCSIFTDLYYFCAQLPDDCIGSVKKLLKKESIAVRTSLRSSFVHRLAPLTAFCCRCVAVCLLMGWALTAEGTDWVGVPESVQRIIDGRDAYRPGVNGMMSRQRHDVTAVALDNPYTGLLKAELRWHPELFARYLDNTLTGEPVVFISAHEKCYTEQFDSAGYTIDTRRTYLLDKSSLETALTRLETALSVQHSALDSVTDIVSRRSGIDDFLAEEEIEGPLNRYLGHTDIFTDDICIIDHRFPSPLSPYGTIVYRYTPGDDLMVRGVRCHDVAFEPIDPRMDALSGHLFIDADEGYLRSVYLYLPSHVKIDFVRGLSMAQEFCRTDDGQLMLTHESLLCHFVVNKLGMEKLGGLAVLKETSLPPPPSKRGGASDGADNKLGVNELCADTTTRDQGYNVAQVSANSPSLGGGWGEATPSKAYTLTEGLIGELRHRFPYRLVEAIGATAYNKYMPSDPLKPKFWFGPAMSTLSFNSVEGVRLRVGGLSSPYLNPHLMGKFYVAYGTRDKRLKYMGELTYSFSEKQKYFTEYPMHAVRIHSDYDLLPLGTRRPDTDDWDDLIESIKHPYHYPYAMQRRHEVAYEAEWANDFSGEVVVRRRDIADPSDTYEPQYFPQGGFGQTELEMNLRYAPGEIYKLELEKRHLVRKETPIFTLSHTMARKGWLDTDFDYQRTEFNYKQRIRFEGYGFCDASVRAGRVWTSDVPVPLLIVPPTMPSTVSSQGIFTDIDPMELVSDRYISWNFTSRTKGLIFNNIPLTRRLKLRQVFGARVLWLSNDVLNNGELENENGDLAAQGIPPIPQDNSQLNPVPYVKLIAGVSNIFKVLEVNYIYRLTYRDVFYTDSDGLQVKLKLKF